MVNPPIKTRLSVNVNKVATLRNTRSIGIPSVTTAASICLSAGADGITVHPRPDQRHIRPQDVYDLAELLKRWADRADGPHEPAEFNIEGNPFHQYMHFIKDVRPTQATLVPDERSASTSDHGWNLHVDGERLKPVISELKELGSRVSLFIDPDPTAVELAHRIGADRIELYTAPFAEAFDSGNVYTGVAPYIEAAKRAHELGLKINAGHDLSLLNLQTFLHFVPGVAEVSIGHALIADALNAGLRKTVCRYVEAADI